MSDRYAATRPLDEPRGGTGPRQEPVVHHDRRRLRDSFPVENGIAPENLYEPGVICRDRPAPDVIILPAPSALPAGSAERKGIPLARGVLDYFPAALAEVAKLSKIGNDKHNPGEEMHHARGKSSDHADCILRHLVDRGKIDPETGLSHSTMVAWRALALLQEELEAAGAPLARAARLP